MTGIINREALIRGRLAWDRGRVCRNAPSPRRTTHHTLPSLHSIPPPSASTHRRNRGDPLAAIHGRPPRLLIRGRGPQPPPASLVRPRLSIRSSPLPVLPLRVRADPSASPSRARGSSVACPRKPVPPAGRIVRFAISNPRRGRCSLRARLPPAAAPCRG
jgi:hypothetical protein